MALNLWRYCEYTDDGCARYQCLKCYGTWEGRSVPGDYNYEPPHQYVAYWNFCPMCGTKWDGPLHKYDERPEYYYGPRRRRVWEAMKIAWQRPHKEPEHPFAWVIEMRATWRNSPPGKWEPEYPDKGFSKSLDGLRWVLNRFHAAQAECAHRNGDEGDDPVLTWEARLVMVRPNRKTIIVKSPDPADMEGK